MTCCAQAAAIQNSLLAAFESAEEHKQEYFEFRDMVLADHELDVDALAPAFKEKGEEPPAQEATPGQGDGRESPAAKAKASTEAEADEGEGEEGGDAEEQPPAQRVTLETFRKLMDMLAEQRNRMEALADYRDVSIVRVNCHKLKAALLPAPNTSLAQIHAMLPALSADLFHGFMSEVQTALSRLQHPSAAVEDYVEKIQFLTKVTWVDAIVLAMGTAMR